MPLYERMPIGGQPDPKPYKVQRVDSEGHFVAFVGSCATEQEARANMKRHDWHYTLYQGTKKIWPT